MEGTTVDVLQALLKDSERDSFQRTWWYRVPIPTGAIEARDVLDRQILTVSVSNTHCQP